MTLIKRLTLDMFEFSDVVDYMVNPVNLVGAPGAGLALEFRKRVPDDLFFTPYREACKSKELRIGTIQILEETNNNWGLINLPTKRHYMDVSDKDDIVRGLEALRNTLKNDRYRYASIGIPMLGCGLGKQDYEVVEPLMDNFFHDLDATVILSMSPTRTEYRPRYLSIIGPPQYGSNHSQQEEIDNIVKRIMELWGADLNSYAGIITAGDTTADHYLGGKFYSKKYEDTFVYKNTKKLPIVVKPNQVRNGLSANLMQNNLICEFSDDVIILKPKGYNNNRGVYFQQRIEHDKEKRQREGKYPRRVAVFGDKSHGMKKDTPILPTT